MEREVRRIGSTRIVTHETSSANAATRRSLVRTGAGAATSEMNSLFESK